MSDTETTITKSDSILDLTTELEPAAIFTVDGEEHKLLGLAHLSADEEAVVMATIARLDRIQTQLELTNDDAEAVTLAKRLRVKRIKLLSTLTDLGEDQANSLPLPQQAKLVTAIQREAGLGSDSDSEV